MENSELKKLSSEELKKLVTFPDVIKEKIEKEGIESLTSEEIHKLKFSKKLLELLRARAFENITRDTVQSFETDLSNFLEIIRVKRLEQLPLQLKKLQNELSLESSKVIGYIISDNKEMLESSSKRIKKLDNLIKKIEEEIAKWKNNIDVNSEIEHLIELIFKRGISKDKLPKKLTSDVVDTILDTNQYVNGSKAVNPNESFFSKTLNHLIIDYFAVAFNDDRRSFSKTITREALDFFLILLHADGVLLPEHYGNINSDEENKMIEQYKIYSNLVPEITKLQLRIDSLTGGIIHRKKEMVRLREEFDAFQVSLKRIEEQKKLLNSRSVFDLKTKKEDQRILDVYMTEHQNAYADKLTSMAVFKAFPTYELFHANIIEPLEKEISDAEREIPDLIKLLNDKKRELDEKFPDRSFFDNNHSLIDTYRYVIQLATPEELKLFAEKIREIQFFDDIKTGKISIDSYDAFSDEEQQMIVDYIIQQMDSINNELLSKVTETETKDSTIEEVETHHQKR